MKIIKTRNIIIFIIICTAFISSCQTQQYTIINNNSKENRYVMKNFNDTVSYILGVDIARNLIANLVTINTNLFMQGINDAYNKIDTLFTKTEADNIMKKFQSLQQPKVDEKRSKELAENKATGKAFLENNKKQPGIIETPSGLQYKIIREGSGGEHPKPTSKVTVHYEGRLINGTIFDSSYERGEPATFPLNGVIKGWTEGLQLMSPGAYYEFYIPSDLAYGDNGTRGIPGGSVLIFKVELIRFE